VWRFALRLRHYRIPNSLCFGAIPRHGSLGKPNVKGCGILGSRVALESGGFYATALWAVPHNNSFKPKPLRGSA
jgi:hypothetical protein